MTTRIPVPLIAQLVLHKGGLISLSDITLNLSSGRFDNPVIPPQRINADTCFILLDVCCFDPWGSILEVDLYSLPPDVIGSAARYFFMRDLDNEVTYILRLYSSRGDIYNYALHQSQFKLITS